jgi:AhpD family alkylhydroperoxidase
MSTFAGSSIRPWSSSKSRALKINGRAYCLDMRTKDARAASESEQQRYLLLAWREVPFSSERYNQAEKRRSEGRCSASNSTVEM